MPTMSFAARCCIAVLVLGSALSIDHDNVLDNNFAEDLVFSESAIDAPAAKAHFPS